MKIFNLFKRQKCEHKWIVRMVFLAFHRGYPYEAYDIIKTCSSCGKEIVLLKNVFSYHKDRETLKSCYKEGIKMLKVIKQQNPEYMVQCIDF